jgi:hypothetical protein
VALALVLVVVVAAAAGGRAAGAVAALSSAAAFDFFHTRPYISLAIKSHDDIETTGLLLVIGLLVGQLALTSARRSREASAGHREVSRLYRVVGQAAGGSDPADVLTSVRAELLDLLSLTDCRWVPGSGPTDLPTLASSGCFESGTVHHFRDDGFELPPEGFALPVRARGTRLGDLVCTPAAGRGVSLEQRRVAVALADELGLAMAAAGASASVATA